VDDDSECPNGGGTGVNCNQYTVKEQVYLNGGPSDAFLPDGWYCFSVYNPNTDTLLSLDDSSERTFSVVNGNIVYGGLHETGIDSRGVDDDEETTIQFAPFDDTTNNGGVYKYALYQYAEEPDGSGTECDQDGITAQKSDNFKIAEDAEVPQAVVTVTKTANTTFTRTCVWDIDKTSATAALTLAPGGSSNVNYTAVASVNCANDSAFAVSGSITVSNAGPGSAVIASVGDSLGGTLNCGGATFPVTLADPLLGPPTTLVCTYSVPLTGPTGGQNTAFANVVVDGIEVRVESDPVLFTFGGPTTTVDACVSVSDDKYGVLDAELCFDDPAADFTFNYTQRVTAPAGSCTAFTYTNTATVNIATGTDPSDSHEVNVSVLCVTVTKTATGTFTRTCDWDIVKSTTTGPISLPPGGSTTANYSVLVTVDCTDSLFAVAGSITVSNTGSAPAPVTAIVDNLGGTLSCTPSLPTTLAPGTSVVCTYSVSRTDGTAGTNTATATVTGLAPVVSAPAAFSFPAPTTTVNGCVTVNDNKFGPLNGGNQLCYQNEPAGGWIFTYSLTVNAGQVCTTFNFVNIASLSTGETSQVSIPVSVPCVRGFTQGFWSNKNGQAMIPSTFSYQLGSGICGELVEKSETATILPGKNAHNGHSLMADTGCVIAEGTSLGAFNNLLSQTLALHLNITLKAGYAGQTIAGLGCTAEAAGTGLAGTTTVEGVLAAANADIAAGGPNAGAFNTLLGCLNKEV
jgi:hypothetical protein